MMKLSLLILLFAVPAGAQMDINGYFTSSNGAIVPASECVGNQPCSLAAGSVLTSSGSVIIKSTTSTMVPLILQMTPAGASTSGLNNPTSDAFVTTNKNTSPTVSWENVSNGNGILDIVNNSASGGDLSKIRLDNGSDAVAIVAGNATQLTLNASATGVVFRATAKVVINGPTSFGGVNYSSAALKNVTSTATSLYACFAGSSIAWTSNGNLANIAYSGEFSNGTLASVNSLAVLIDGALVAPQDATHWAYYDTEAVASDVSPVNFNFRFKPTAAVHTACLAGVVSAGTMTLGANSVGEFSVMEY